MNTKKPSGPINFINNETVIGPKIAPIPINIFIEELAATISSGCKKSLVWATVVSASVSSFLRKKLEL